MGWNGGFKLERAAGISAGVLPGRHDQMLKENEHDGVKERKREAVYSCWVECEGKAGVDGNVGKLSAATVRQTSNASIAIPHPPCLHFSRAPRKQARTHSRSATYSPFQELRGAYRETAQKLLSSSERNKQQVSAPEVKGREGVGESLARGRNRVVAVEVKGIGG